MCEIQENDRSTELKTVEFGEEQLSDIASITQALFGDCNDPRSFAYVRKLERPKINWFLIVLALAGPIVLSVAVLYLLKIFGILSPLYIVIAVLLLCAYGLLMLKRACICAVKIYQRFAPDSLRNKCRFEPSCSQYMIMAIEKYGVVKGMRKGIDRLKRCNTNGGGYDLP